MKRIFILLLFLIGLTVYGTDYYVKNGGNDALSGLDDANAWETLTKVNGFDYTAGDKVSFKRGGTWIGQISPQGGTVESGTEADPIVFTAYGTGAKPIITLADALPGWTVSGNWRSLTSNRYAIAFVPSVSRFIIDGSEIRKASSIQAVNATNRYYIKASVDSLYIYSTGNPATTYTTMVATYPNVAYTGTAYLYDDNWITMSYLDFQGGYYSAYTTRGQGVVFDSCRIGYYSAYFGISIGGTAGNPSKYVTVKNCEINSNCAFDEVFSADYTEDGIRINGQASVVMIDSNTVKNWWHSGCYLYNLTSTYLNDSIFIRYNDISAPDLPDGNGMITDTYGNNATNVYVYRNYFHDLNTNIQLATEGLYFYYNIIDNIDGCPYEAGVGSGLNISGYAATTAPQNMKIWNNVIGNCADYGITISQYTGRMLKYNNEFKNNIIFNCTDEELRIYNDPVIATGVYDNIYQNNLLYDSGTTDVIAYWSVAMTVAEFEALNGTHGDDMGFNIGDNPDFDGATFELLVTSPAINAGADVGVSLDYAGVSVPQGTYTDIGAYEFEDFPIATTGLGWEDILSKRNFKDAVNFAQGFSVEGVPIVFSGGSPVNIPGLTASASELNILDGATLTTIELNYVDGVTSAIQTQINAKNFEEFQLIVGVDAEAPIAGDSTLTHTHFNGMFVLLQRDGDEPRLNATATNTYEGYRHTTSTLTVNPVWQANEQIRVRIYSTTIRTVILPE